MLSPQTINPSLERQVAIRGESLLRRSDSSAWVCYVESGRVALGVMEGDAMEHQLGVVVGPCWLEATSAVLNLPNALDAMAETEVCLRRVPLAEFRRSLSEMPKPAQAVLHDVAMAHRQQTELAVSRMAKDAEARCAEWLLRNAQVDVEGVMTVQLQQRKRAIAAQLNIAPETLSRVLRHLREHSLISGTGRALNLMDPTGLRSLAGI
ncbi:MAG: Crp/Fnr family transcriptional regulator [Rhodoferax sp.]|uniref:Crp/Fnr family transcriptional regulator n=1 Tax=Rhodoferax sp. TaxID=50421 RepID=UPI00301AA3DB